MIANILEITGLLAISLGAALVSIPLGICALGITCVLIGIAIEKDKF